jgi:diaminohydroxyphosphoribosylaminopyrimidine deaminase/5-amino-6-(5-phosphoribosylamino)uracil reductase
MLSEYYLLLALEEARKANPLEVRPNPLVGAILVDENQSIVGRGYHKQVGTPHAEVHAIEDAKNNGADLTKCTLYVTLEPCSHHGKTPPCTDLIIRSRIPVVVVASRDPNPLVSGFEVLQKANITVEFVHLEEVDKLNKVFLVNQQQGRPFFALKMAISQNGMIGKKGVGRFWLSNKYSRHFVHEHLRKETDAILTTAKTVIQDNAKMNIRVEGEDEQELNLVVVDRGLQLLQEENKGLSIFYPRNRTKIYLVTDLAVDLGHDRTDVEVLVVPFTVDGRVDVSVLGKRLLEKQFCHVLVEAGAMLGQSMLKEDIIDEVHLFVAPTHIEENDGIPFLHIDNLNIVEESLKGFMLSKKEEISGDQYLVFSKET